MKIAPPLRIKAAWARMDTVAKVELVFTAVPVKLITVFQEAIMRSRKIRIGLLVSIVAYGFFFMTFYDKIGRFGFFGGVILGIVLTLMLLASVWPRDPNQPK